MHATTEIWDGEREICSGLRLLGVAGSVASLGVTATLRQQLLEFMGVVLKS